MRILIIGAGGVGSSAALIAARRDFYDSVVIADYDGSRAQTLAERIDDPVSARSDSMPPTHKRWRRLAAATRSPTCSTLSIHVS